MTVQDKTPVNYYDQVATAPNMYESAAELGLLIWPVYPEVLASYSLGELLIWIRHFSHVRIKKLLAYHGLVGDFRLGELSEIHRQNLSDALINVRTLNLHAS